jgi:hypothetical protein
MRTRSVSQAATASAIEAHEHDLSPALWILLHTTFAKAFPAASVSTEADLGPKEFALALERNPALAFVQAEPVRSSIFVVPPLADTVAVAGERALSDMLWSLSRRAVVRSRAAMWAWAEQRLVRRADPFLLDRLDIEYHLRWAPERLIEEMREQGVISR